MKRRVVSLLLVFCMVFTMLPMGAFAIEGNMSVTTYDVWVGSTRVTSDNKGAITGDGITGTVTYAPDTNTLTLKGATISDVASASDNGLDFNNVAGILSKTASKLIVKLIGTNAIDLSSINASLRPRGLMSAPDLNRCSDLEIEGNSPADRLTINIGTTSEFAYGIEANKVTISNCTVSSSSGNSTGVNNNPRIGIGASGGLSFVNANVTAIGGTTTSLSNGIQGNVTIDDLSTFAANGETVAIRNGTLTAAEGSVVWGGEAADRVEKISAANHASYKFIKVTPDLTTPRVYGDFLVSVDKGNTAPTFADGVLTFGTGGEYTVAMKNGVTYTSNAIVVTASGVSLNLDGITISAPQGAPNSDGITALTVTNGTVLNVVSDTSLTGGVAGPGTGGRGGAGIRGNVVLKGSATLTVTGGNGNGSTENTAGHGIAGDVNVSGAVSLIAQCGSSGMAGMAINGGLFAGGTITVAEGYTVWNGNDPINIGPLEGNSTTAKYVKIIPDPVRSFDIAKGDITVEDSNKTGKIKVTYKDANNTQKTEDTIDPADMLTITQTNADTQTTNKVVVNATSPVKITLDGVNILQSNDSPLKLQDTAVVKLTLKENTNNILEGGSIYSGLGVAIGASVTIDGAGTLTASNNSYGSGIGGDNCCGSIIIKGGTITASAAPYGNAAGIGGAVASNGGTVVIDGGNVKATGSTNAEDIGKGTAGVSSGTLKNTSGDNVYLASFTEPTDNKGKVFAITKANDVSYTYDLSTAKAIDGTWYVYLPLGDAEASYDGVTYMTTVTNDHTAVFSAELPTVDQYLEDNPATADTDYVLNETDKTLVIKTTKGAAFWSKNGNSYLDYMITLENHIDVGEFLWSPVGNSNSNAFRGIFDGKGHTLSGLTVASSGHVANPDVYAGLIGYLTGTVKNSGLTNSSISVNEPSITTVWVGGIAAYVNGGNISNCFYTGDVGSIANQYARAGGIAGFVTQNSSVKNCYVKVDATASFTSSSIRNSHAGPITAMLGLNSTIADCYYFDASTFTAENINTQGTSLTEAQMKGASGTTDALIDKLNAWIDTQKSTAYYTWAEDDTDKPTNGGYPVFGTAWTAPHKHCVCGGDTNIGDHTNHSDIIFTPINNTDKFPGSDGEMAFNGWGITGGNYYLTEDIDLDKALFVLDGAPVNLCLNGHSIKNTANLAFQVNETLHISDCKGTGTIENAQGYAINISFENEFHLYGGKITNNKSGILNNNGTIKMYGGSITNNIGSSTQAGGIENKGALTIYGGSITNNSGTLAGGIFHISGSMSLGGNVEIFGNKVGNSNRNITLYKGTENGPQTTISLLSALTQQTPIGVSIMSSATSALLPGVFTSGDTVKNSDYLSKFTADNSSFVVTVAEDNQLTLKLAPPTITAGGNQSIIPSSSSDLVVTSSAALADFQRVEVAKQGAAPTTLTEDAHYTKASGSTIATLKNSYLKTLSAGTYTLNIVSTTGTATTTFTMNASGGGSSGGGSSYDYYNIKITKEGKGTISPDGGWNNTVAIREWQDQTFTFTPEKGYVVSDVLVDGKSVGAKTGYTFKDVTTDHTLKLIFKTSSNGHVNPQTGVAFEDVQETDWFVDAVYFAVNSGWFHGTSKTTFRPNGNTTRGMIATVLWRMEKEPTASVTSIFEDVARGAYYADGVNWALENGIVVGYGNGKFGPDDSITREQMASILSRYAQFKGYGVSKTASLDRFSDGVTTSDYAKTPMAWAVENGIISGKGNGILDPRGKATRAEVATILTRFHEMFSEK